MAVRRLVQLERRLDKNEELRRRYNEAMQTYLDQKHMVMVPEEKLKLFNGSAKTTSNYSLNDALMTGPVIQDPLFDLVLRFRKYFIALVGGIEKMYLQVKQLAHDKGSQFPRAKAALLNDFYIDDFIGGADSESEAILLRQELEQLMPKGGFRLRKWVSNAKSALAGLTADELGTQSSLSFDQELVKTLGIHWQPGPDLLGVDVSCLAVNGQWTRRKVYSVIAQLWDPCGFTAPVISWAKVHMQLLWVASQGWDDPLSQDLASRWTDFYQQLPKLSDIKVDRHAFTNHPILIQFHVFSDASEAAYGVCIYARSINQLGQIKVELFAAKSRPASLKKTTLARLELCGAFMAAKLYRSIVKALGMNRTETWFWSDSTVVLSWLKRPSYVWPTFVANRVSHIQELTKGHRWNHVKGTGNPADLVSRRVMPRDLVDMQHWFNGPPWLSLLDQHWNIEQNLKYEEPSEELLEKKKHVFVARTA
ncbi:uncharacterized protein LOC135712250 [Ochlerotatus camptorhynchus]|uniref:uncharacterized protein LOC135712250 n=1 Tax=Ochlerotatus camptorhynchus TaxID=644619 RepID=UPI0031E40535